MEDGRISIELPHQCHLSFVISILKGKIVCCIMFITLLLVSGFHPAGNVLILYHRNLQTKRGFSYLLNSYIFFRVPKGDRSTFHQDRTASRRYRQRLAGCYFPAVSRRKLNLCPLTLAAIILLRLGHEWSESLCRCVKNE